ncbi:MAG: methylmalonyl Co-A mutase-associated GTPase MeaB [Gemmatimonadota bacterium]
MIVHPPSDGNRALLDDFTARKRVALSRAITLVENQRAGFRALLDELHPRLGRAHRIGITGPPGAGKSTLTAELIAHYRARSEKVGVIVVDPTSPFTGGALLGDRIRMNEISMDAGVFVRSMATRGSLGGLALTTIQVADVMDAYGFERVIVETVGVGQSELDIASAADSTVLVLVPESGDGIQAMKAGVMEAADLFVVNKADRPGADRLAREVSMMLHLRTGNAPRRAGSEPADAAWEIPVLKTIAQTGDGVSGLAELLDRHRTWLASSGELSRRRRKRAAERVREEVARSLSEAAWREHGGAEILERALPELESGEASPHEVASRILRATLRE